MAQLIPLTTEEMRSGFTHKAVITGTDIAAMTSGTAISIYPAYGSTATKTGLLVLNAAVYVKTGVTYAAGTLAVTVGDNATAAAYVASTDVKTSGTIGPGAQTAAALAPSGNIIKCTFTVGAGSINTAAGGEVHIYLCLADMGELSK